MLDLFSYLALMKGFSLSLPLSHPLIFSCIFLPIVVSHLPTTVAPSFPRPNTTLLRPNDLAQKLRPPPQRLSDLPILHPNPLLDLRFPFHQLLQFPDMRSISFLANTDAPSAASQPRKEQGGSGIRTLASRDFPGERRSKLRVVGHTHRVWRISFGVLRGDVRVPVVIQDVNTGLL